MADLCGALAEGTRAGIPMDVLLTQVGGLDVSPTLQFRIGHWRHFVIMGIGIDKAASQARMPELLCGMLSEQMNDDALTKAFDFLARVYRARFSRLLIVLQGFMQPLIVLVLGLIVGVIVYAFFTPIVKLLESVTGMPEVF